MNLTEATQLCGMVSQLCPKQKFEDFTPDAWQLVMDDITLADAVKAVRTVYRTQGSDQQWGSRQIEPDDIIREVKRVVNRRLEAYGPIIPPAELADDPRAEADWLREFRRRIASGEHVPQQTRGELKARDMRVLEGVLSHHNLSNQPAPTNEGEAA